MRRAVLNPIVRLLLLLSAMLLAGCVQDPDDRDFYYHGWTRPKMTPDDRDYFYADKTRRSGPPEDPRLPSGQLQ